MHILLRTANNRRTDGDATRLTHARLQRATYVADTSKSSDAGGGLGRRRASAGCTLMERANHSTELFLLVQFVLFSPFISGRGLFTLDISIVSRPFYSAERAA